MKTVCLLVIVLAFHFASFAQEAPKTFKGEIGDSSCAMNIHSLTRSHQEMLKSGKMGTTAADCSHYCVQHLSAEYVLADKKSVYHLDPASQAEAEKLAGQKVTLKGTLDEKTNTIHVLDWGQN
jgi:hypothetical protein